jgi:hypothetical protein
MEAVCRVFAAPVKIAPFPLVNWLVYLNVSAVNLLFNSFGVNDYIAKLSRSLLSPFGTFGSI